MRYENITTHFNDINCLDFTSNNGSEGNFIINTNDELIDIVNAIRKEQGNIDLVDVNDNNEVYYNFYLLFDIEKKTVSIQAVCNHGEKDDEVWYELPMTEEEKTNVMWKLVNMLAKVIYDS
uniref:Uncharacterized protein n=1 Tax=Siphoviridae sp. ctXZx16 TaxID=2826371 RepID=A0A8S5MM20_9CAUD|nr:MAG TPA: hypothetical protein [Siphoviridae sp. ctXZx16]